ncbi:MAG: hypothetical protein GIW99_03220 [Candidatus Eremiobacteraeota bacterium]|nr:hypothetical protein [Candidatus Eremiobacteraeota bacterium]MBC5826684.1 hypothetical protein [Candidatus Eremiobacteraeota bacterium]
MTADRIVAVAGIAVSVACAVFLIVLLTLTALRFAKLRQRVKRVQAHPTLAAMRSLPLIAASLGSKTAGLSDVSRHYHDTCRQLTAAAGSYSATAQAVRLLGACVDAALESIVPSLRGMLAR